MRCRDRARAAAPAQVPHLRRRGACRDAAPARHRGPAPPLRGSRPRRGPRAAGVRAFGDRGDGLRLLLPDRLGLRQVRQGGRHRRRTGTGFRGGVDRCLLPQHHRPRSTLQPAAVRALPESCAQVDAGHRHRLLGPRSRAGDPLRGREVRARVGGPDHHVRQDGAARRHPRRRPCARLRLRDRRQDRQADPGAGTRSQPELQGGASPTARSSSTPTTPIRTRGASSTSRAGSRGSSATTRFTPPRL